MEEKKLSYTTCSFDLERVEKGKKVVNKLTKNITFAFAKGGVENRACRCF